MHCRACNYPLWNLPGRACPECGAAFLPSQFEFVPNSVRFCCPHCRTAYYGTDAKGHLVPSAFNCVGCSQSITMDACVVLPALGITDDQTKPESFPWLDRGKRWRLGSWLSMMSRGMFAPNRVVRSIPPTAPMGFVFGLTIATVVSWGSLLPFLMIPLVAAGSASPSRVAAMAGWGLLFLAITTASSAIAFLLWIVVAHAVMTITGGVSDGIARSGHAFCYTAPVMLLAVIPCLGFYLWPMLALWWCVSISIALAEVHKASVLRGFLAVAAIPLVITIVIILLVIFR